MNEDNLLSTLSDGSPIQEWLKERIYLKAENWSLLFALCEEVKTLIQIAKNLQLFQQVDVQYVPLWQTTLDWVEKIKNNITVDNDTTISANNLPAKLSKKQIKERYVIAFLMSKTEDKKLQVYRATYFTFCLKMLVLTKFDSRINETLNNLRFLNDTTRDFLLPFLPDIDKYSNLQEFHKALEPLQKADFYTDWMQIDSSVTQKFIAQVKGRKVRADAKNFTDFKSLSDSEVVNIKFAEFIYDFILPIRNCLENKDGIIRQTSNRKSLPELIELPAITDEVTGDSSETLVSTNQEITDFETENTFENDEVRHDTYIHIVSVNVAEPITPAIDKVNAIKQVKLQRIRHFQPYTDIRVANTYEIRIFIQNIFDILAKVDIDYRHNEESSEYNENLILSNEQKSAIFLMLLFLTGTVATFKEEHTWRHFLYYGCLEFEFTPVRANLDEKFSVGFSQKNVSKLKILLPPKVATLVIALQERLTHGIDYTEVQNNAQSLLKKINKTHQTHLSLTKIVSYMRFILQREGVDDAVISILNFESINHFAGLPYFNISQRDVYYAQNAYLYHLQVMMNVETESFYAFNSDENFLTLADLIVLPAKEIYRDDETLQMGTKLTLIQKKLSQDWILPLRNQLKALTATRLDNIENFVMCHNLLMDYLYVMLGLGTGYRPVVETFGRFDDVDLETGFYFISDKENRQQPAGRFIFLPATLLRQLKYYAQYLDYHITYFAKINKPLYRILKHIRASEIGMIQYLEIDDLENIQLVANQNSNFIAQRQAQYASLPLNWYRHHLRSLKDVGTGYFSIPHNYSDKKIHSDIISSFMGHSDALGYDYYNVYSGLKRLEQKKLAHIIDDLLQSYGFNALQFS